MNKNLAKKVEEIVYEYGAGVVDNAKATKQLLSLFQDYLNECVGENYRPDDNSWEKAKYGYRVRWYGQGYNDAKNQIRKRGGIDAKKQTKK